MKAEELAVIKERADKATEGPWMHSPYYEEDYGEVTSIKGVDVAEYLTIEDAQFIAHAREDVPKLVAEVERLRSVVWRISDYCDMSVEETRAYLDGDDDE